MYFSLIITLTKLKNYIRPIEVKFRYENQFDGFSNYFIVTSSLQNYIQPGNDGENNSEVILELCMTFGNYILR